MRVTCDNKDLQRAFALFYRFVNARAVLPIIQSVLIEALPGAEHITCTVSDLDTWVKVVIPASVSEAGKTCVSFKALHQSLEVLPRSPVTFDATGDWFKTSVPDVAIEIFKREAEDFPFLPEYEGLCNSFDVPAKDFARAIEQVAPFRSLEYCRSVLQFVALELASNGMRMVATDTHRLMTKRFAASDVDWADSHTAMMHGDVLTKIQKWLKCEKEGAARITTWSDPGDKKSGWRLECNGLTIWSRSYKGPFPQWRKVVSHNHPKTLTASRENLLSALKFAYIAARHNSEKVTLSLHKHSMEIAAETSEGIRAQVKVQDVLWNGEPMQTAFNARYMIELLSKFPAPRVILRFNDPLNPILICDAGFDSPDPDLFSVLMPMQVQ
jgi:DNA polymerase III subunit beta